MDLLMPLSAQHKQQSRVRILKSAVKLFARQGFDSTPINQVMDDAGLTRGAFYAHFASKSDLYRASITAATQESALLRERPANMSDEQWLDTVLSGYLSMAHIDKSDSPCPLASLTTDVAVREADVRGTYTDVFKGMNDLIYANTRTSNGLDRNQVLALSAMMIGGVAVGRALNDKGMTKALLAACRSTVKTMLAQNEHADT